MPDPLDPKAHIHPYRWRRSSVDVSVFSIGKGGCGAAECQYVELAVTSNFTFLRGASHPDELVRQAGQLGYEAIAITDWNSLAGVVRGHVAAKQAGLRLVVGCRLVLADPCGLSLLVFPTNRTAYGRLCRLLTLGKRRAAKGECHLTLADVLEYQEGMLGVVMGLSLDDWRLTIGETREEGARENVKTSQHQNVKTSQHQNVKISKNPNDERTERYEGEILIDGALGALRDAFGDDRLSLAVTRLYGSDDRELMARTAVLGKAAGIPLVAVNDVFYHAPERRILQDVLTCVRHGCTLAEAGFRLFPNGERYLKSPEEMARLFADRPAVVARSAEIAARASGFTLDELRYEYPDETCPPGVGPMEHLKVLVWEGASERYGQSVPEKVRRQIEHEFALIGELRYAPYFLTVHDLVKFARSRGILCQGRGAAANSAVCFCLGVTSVDPDRIDLLFERFVSRERDEPPDIDIDFEHERREEVIQYIYEKYGRERAGLTAEVITYRRRSAIRDVGKALGFSMDAVDRIAKRVDTWEKNPFADSEGGDVPAQLTALGYDATNCTVRQFVALVREVIGFPRHLSQHVGGFVMTRGPLCELVPIENAAMENRTVIEWDKDDIEAMGMLKVDVLGLGILTAIQKCLEWFNRHEGTQARRHEGKQIGTHPGDNGEGCNTSERESPEASGQGTPGNPASRNHSNFSLCLRPSVPPCLTLATIPAEDPVVYEMIDRADTLGVFQIESRAQMTMLPRLRPRCFYDLVIEVAIVRPGPIVGEMVHPYLRRRNGEEKVEYPSETIREVLGKTLGVPLFQEQVMALAIKAAGFTAGEAEKLRRAITAWTAKEDIATFPGRFVEGMVRNGYERSFAEWCFQRFKGFSQYGFPESHAASFALLVYASAWLKRYYPGVYAAALLNSQPMGFYAPAQIVRDAQEHGVEVRGVDVNDSAWDCTMEGTKGRRHEDTKGDVGRSSIVECRWSARAEARGSLRDDRRVLRMGMRMVRGLRKEEATLIVEAVKRCGRFASVFGLWRTSGVSASSLRVLARADAFGSMGLDRQHALWEVQKLKGRALPLLDGIPDRPIESNVALPSVSPRDDVTRDYGSVGLSLKAHPMSFVREKLRKKSVRTAATVKNDRKTPAGRRVAVAGIVLFRQRPGTAKGVMFMTVEDETGRADLIVRPNVYERDRNAAVYGKVVLARGRVERQGSVVHVLADKIEDIEALAGDLPTSSRDFR